MNTVDEAHKLDAAMAFLRLAASPPVGLEPIEAIRREGDRWWALALLAEVERLHAMEARATAVRDRLRDVPRAPVSRGWLLAAEHILTGG